LLLVVLLLHLLLELHLSLLASTSLGSSQLFQMESLALLQQSLRYATKGKINKTVRVRKERKCKIPVAGTQGLPFRGP